jgi:hypothetical protein
MKIRKNHFWIMLFWVMTPCNLVGGYRRFGVTHCLHLLVPPKCSKHPQDEDAWRHNPEHQNKIFHHRENLLRTSVFWRQKHIQEEVKSKLKVKFGHFVLSLCKNLKIKIKRSLPAELHEFEI